MTPATLSDRKAQLLLRIRWLVWGAMASLIVAHLAVAFAQPTQPEILPHEQTAAHADDACGCTHDTETI